MIKKIFSRIQHPINTARKFYHRFYLMPKYTNTQAESHNEFLSNIFTNQIDDYRDITDEVIENDRFNESIKEAYEFAGIYYSPLERNSWPVTLYYVIRKIKPEFLAETGVFYGVSSSYILAALHTNNCGRLYSIDLPAYFNTDGHINNNPYRHKLDSICKLPKGKEPGFIVPPFLKDRWELILGDSRELLPQLFKKLVTIDLFLHDGDHSYANMKFEFELVFKYLRKNGFIAADNIDWNKAFPEFCMNNQCSFYSYLAYFESAKQKFKHNFGMIRKD